MTFIHPLLSWFLLLGVIPVILHLLLRAKPQKLIFPALRLIKNRQRQNVQRMRLKHIWLMLLRVFVILLLVLAVTRPRIPPVNYWPTAGEWVTLGSILVAAIGVWLGLTWQWHRQQVPAFQLRHRRTLLRAGVLAGAAVLTLLLVLWPLQRRVFAQIKEPQVQVSENVPVASVLVFDTSLSMQYRQAGQTRLEVARDLALEHLRQLPGGSRIAIADTSSANQIAFLPDLTAGSNRLGTLEVKAISHSLNDRVRAALELQNEDLSRVQEVDVALPVSERQNAFVREIIVFSDMSPAAWQQSDTNLLKAELEKDKSVNLYLIDVGLPQPTNIGLSDLKVSDSTLTAGSPLRVQATVSATGRDAATVAIDLSVLGEEGRLVPKDTKSVELRGAEGAVAQLTVSGLTGSLVQGELRLKSDDPLEFDNALYFTVEIQPPLDVLLVADDLADTKFWATALAPPTLQKLGRVKYRCTQLISSKLATTELAKYAAVCLINVRDLPEVAWRHLGEYVDAGGGAAVILGSRGINIVSYDLPAAQAFLPAELRGNVPFEPPEYIDLTNKLDHPLLKKFADWGGGVADLTAAEIRRIWRVKAKPNASVIAWYTSENKSPAILEKVHGKGRTVMLTTSVSSSAADDLQDQWNNLPTRWSFIAFADQMMRYLSRQSQGTFNYVSGEDAIVRLDPERPIQQYLLRKPNSQQLPGEVPPGKSSLVIRTMDQLGHYRFLDAASGSNFQRGFSVNAPTRENLLTPISTAELDEILGKDRYSLARAFDQLDKKGLRGQRIGLEVFPFLMLLMWLVFMGEHLVANRFYDAEPAPAVS
jgi:hypothetical protein